MRNSERNAGLTRREILKLGISSLLMFTAGPVFPAAAQATETPDLVLLNLADLHSSYDRLPQLLTLVREIKSRNPNVPHVLLFNGDLFEPGNVVAARSIGVADWAFLRAVQREMPVIFNIGNHEADFMDQQEFVRRARALGCTVITNLYDQRTGLPYARTFTTIQVGNRAIPVLGLGVNVLSTYPGKVRPTLLLPDPVQFFQSTYPVLSTGAPMTVVLSHAGVVPDRTILPQLKGTNLMVGGHDHLHLRHDVGQSVYLHNGFKGERMNVVNVKFGADGVRLDSQDVNVTSQTAADAVLSQNIRAQRIRHLQPADLEVIGRMTQPLSVQQAALWAVEAVRQATGADIAALNHTSFGRGFPPGPVSRADFNEFLRFDNKVMTVQIDAATLAGLLQLANQHEAHGFEQLTGDFVYTNRIQPEPGRPYTLVTSDYLTLPDNQPRYFGRTGLPFQVMADLTTKGILQREVAKTP